MDAGHRARAWRRDELRRICGGLEPWAHGVLARADEFPNFYEFNRVCVDEAPRGGLDDLIVVADRALHGLGHRRIDFEHADHGEPFHSEFIARGWLARRLVRMRYIGTRPPGTLAPDPATEVRIEELPYDGVRALRIEWHEEEYPTVPLGDLLDHARQVELRRGARLLAALDSDGTPLGYAQLEVFGDGAEITSVFVRAGARGAGIGTALTAAAIRHAPPVRDLWITADAEGRPQHLYSRLGFTPVARDLQFVRILG